MSTNPDFSRVLVVRHPSEDGEFLEFKVSDVSPLPAITATFTALTATGRFASEQWFPDGTSSRLRFTAENWTRIVGTGSYLYEGSTVVLTLIYDRMWPTEPSGADLAYFSQGGGIGQPTSPNRQEEREPVRSQGSGFILPSRRVVATNYHVIEGAERVEVLAHESDDWVPVTVGPMDRANDLALLTLPDDFEIDVDAVSYGVWTGQEVTLGAEVHVIGYPMSDVFGSSVRFTSGTISALVGLNDDPRLLQFTAPIQPGNSGGPLVDTRGRVMGVVVSTVNSGLFLEETGIVPQNANFAVKIDYLMLLAGNHFRALPVPSMEDLLPHEVAARFGAWVVQIRATR